MNILNTFFGWFRFGGLALGDRKGSQIGNPSEALISDIPAVGVDAALQISAVWRSVELIAKTVATLPVMVYETRQGQRTLARESKLWMLLHESPNSRMTPCELWTALLLNLLFRGNGYARIERDLNGEVYAIWPMASDQTEMRVLEDGSVVYLYYVGSDIAVLAEDSVFHLKEMGNGTIGLSRLNYMRSTAAEAANSQHAANKLFANGGKPTGVLMLDKILNEDQRKALQKNFADMATGSTSRLYVLEANMKYEQINLSPEDMQLLMTRQYGVEECCRWFGVPPVLVGHSNVTAWGTGIDSLIEGFYKFTIRPSLVNIEQAIRKRMMTAKQRSLYTVEFSFDGLLRATLKDRMEIYSKAVQNGIKTRNECRQLENDPPLAGGDDLTAQVNLVPVAMLGKIKPTGGSIGTQDVISN